MHGGQTRSRIGPSPRRRPRGRLDAAPPPLPPGGGGLPVPGLADWHPRASVRPGWPSRPRCSCGPASASRLRRLARRGARESLHLVGVGVGGHVVAGHALAVVGVVPRLLLLEGVDGLGRLPLRVLGERAPASCPARPCPARRLARPGRWSRRAPSRMSLTAPQAHRARSRKRRAVRVGRARPARWRRLDCDDVSAQAPSAVILVRADKFLPNPATAADNAFQSDAPRGSPTRRSRPARCARWTRWPRRCAPPASGSTSSTTRTTPGRTACSPTTGSRPTRAAASRSSRCTPRTGATSAAPTCWSC